MKWILLLMLGVLPSTAVAQSAEEFFDNQTLHDVELFINSRDLSEMLERYTEELYFPADFAWRGVRVRNVGVRIRGLATRSRIKPGLRIDFNRYVEGQQFLGLNALVLDNALTDASFIRERTSMAFIARMGGPAPRESFTRVFVNGTFVGLYALVEAVDARFLARTLGEGTGYLFEHRYLNGFHSEYLGRDLTEYKDRFEAETHQREADATVYGPVHDLFYEINQEVDGAWRERVSRYVDLPQLVRYVAIEMFLNEIDGFLGGAGMANFFLYRPAGSQVHRVLPWDRDTTFQNSEESVFTRVQDNQLFRRALMFDDLRTLYLDVLAECARVASEGRWLENEIIQMHMVINDAVYQDPLKPFAYEEYSRHINYLLWFAQRRPVVVMDEVARSR
jgi:spore coat protein CotH